MIVGAAWLTRQRTRLTDYAVELTSREDTRIIIRREASDKVAAN